MRWKKLVVGGAVLLSVVACTAEPRASAASGIPAAWYGVVSEAIARTPGVGEMAIVENGGPCPVRERISVDGRNVTDALGHGVQRLDGVVPAVLCQWYQGTPVELTVAQATDDAGYRTLVDGAAAIRRPGNVQTEQDVAVGARTVQVVRTTYPTNAAAGTDFEAFYLDEPSRGRVSLRVSNSAQRSAQYDEKAVALDLVTYLDG
jgi:hypothetical protein